MSAAGSSNAASSAAAAPRSASLRLQALLNTAGSFAYYAVLFLLTPLAMRELGSEGWGIWQLVGATTAYASLFSLGLGSAIHYQVAHNLARVDLDRLASAFTNARIYLLCAAALLLLVLFGVGEPLMRSLVEPAQREVAWSALLLTVGLTALTLPLRLYPSTLAGLQRLDLHGAIQLVCSLLLLPAAWLGFEAGMGLRSFAVLMTLGSIVPVFPAWVLAHRLLPPGSLRFRGIDLRLLRELLAYSVNTLVYVAGTVALYQTMKFVAAWRCGGTAAAGEISLSITIVQILGVIFTPISVTLLSRFSQLDSDRRGAEMSALLERAAVAVGLLLVPGALFLFCDARTIFAAWVGGELTGAAFDEVVLTTRLMLGGQASYVLALPLYYALLGVGRHWPFGIGMLVAALANAGLGWIAAGHEPRIAALGLVFGVVTTLLAAFVALPLAVRRFGLGLGRLLSRTLLLPGALALPGLLALQLAPTLGQPLLDLLVHAALFAAFCAPGLEWARRRVLHISLGMRMERV